MKKQLAIVALAGVLLFPSLGLAQTQNASTTEQTTQYLIDSLRAELQTLLMDLVHQLQLELAALTERVDAVAPEGDDDDDGGAAQQQQAQSDDDDDGIEPYKVTTHASAWLYNPEDAGLEGDRYYRGVLVQMRGYMDTDNISIDLVGYEPEDTEEERDNDGYYSAIYYYEVPLPELNSELRYNLATKFNGIEKRSDLIYSLRYTKGQYTEIEDVDLADLHYEASADHDWTYDVKSDGEVVIY